MSSASFVKDANSDAPFVLVGERERDMLVGMVFVVVVGVSVGAAVAAVVRVASRHVLDERAFLGPFGLL